MHQKPLSMNQNPIRFCQPQSIAAPRFSDTAPTALATKCPNFGAKTAISHKTRPNSRSVLSCTKPAPTQKPPMTKPRTFSSSVRVCRALACIHRSSWSLNPVRPDFIDSQHFHSICHRPHFFITVLLDHNSSARTIDRRHHAFLPLPGTVRRMVAHCPLPTAH